MGAGKSTLGQEVARRLARPFVDLDAEIERHASASISTIFATRGEVEFRAIEERLACEALDSAAPAVISLGGGAMVSKMTARKLRERALTVLVEVDIDEAWKRARRSRRRPLAERESEFRELFEQRLPLYEDAADARARDADDIVLAAAGILVEEGAYDSLARARGMRGRDRRARPRASSAAARSSDARGRREQTLATASVSGARCASSAAGRWSPSAVARPPTSGLRRRHLPARHSVDRRADDARRPGRRGHRREDRHRSPRGEEPRRRVPLAGAHRHRSRAARTLPQPSAGTAWRRS